MKLSIITINKDNAPGLSKTIQSVVSQTWQEFEYIIIDGASNDESLEVIMQFINQPNNKPFKWLSEPDIGVYQAMNKGIKMARGEYLLFLNSGDFLANENVIEDVFKDKDYNEDIICGKCNVSKKGKVVWTSNPPVIMTFGTLYNNGLAHQSTFIKRRLFDKYGLYREDFKYNADIDFWYKSIILGNCTTKTIGYIVADYNLEGISSKENTSETYKNEIEEILTPFARFISDYEEFKKQVDSMRMYYWAKKHKVLSVLISFLYKVALIMHRK